MFDSLQDRLENAFKTLKGENKLTEINIAQSVKEIRRALVAADVNYAIAKQFTAKVKEEALGKMNELSGVSAGQLMIKIVQDELIELMGGQSVGINIKASPGVVLVAGLQGSGKTTFVGKLALHLKNKKSKRPLLAACDVYRPAAITQLGVLADQVGVPIYKEEGNKNPVEIAQNAVKYAKQHGFDVVIVDTAGRLAVDEEMMAEIENISNGINPTESLFVVDSMTGQDAVNTAKAFNERIDYDGVVLTKLDGDTRGGAALSIKYTVGKPIKFISTGETLDTLDVFHPDRMANRIMGMGDIVSLVEKAQEQFDEKEAKRLEKKIRKNKFDFNDFITQLGQIRRLGSLKNLMGMIPGFGKMAKQLDEVQSETALKRVEAIIQSMTPFERENPEELIKSRTRKARIARGSGNEANAVNQFLKQFQQMKKMMKMMSQGGMGNMGGGQGQGGSKSRIKGASTGKRRGYRGGSRRRNRR